MKNMNEVRMDTEGLPLKLEYHFIRESEKEEICNWRYEGEYSVYNLPSYEEMKSRQCAFCNPQRAKSFYAFYEGDKLVGFTGIKEKDKEVFISIGVKPELCNKGYGRLMMEYTYKLSKELYPQNPICLEVRTWNIRAINFYKKAGFQIDGDIYEKAAATRIGLFYRMIKK